VFAAIFSLLLDIRPYHPFPPEKGERVGVEVFVFLGESDALLRVTAGDAACEYDAGQRSLSRLNYLVSWSEVIR
jgi:hypothetical protein